jgi:hypothetical protein
MLLLFNKRYAQRPSSSGRRRQSPHPAVIASGIGITFTGIFDSSKIFSAKIE